MLRRLLRTVLLAVLLAGSATLSVRARAASPDLPPFDHLFLIVLENRTFDQVMGNPDMPALNALASDYGSAADHHGVAHPSLPNYVALLTGDTWGSRSDDPAQAFDHPSLAGQLEAAGRSWKGYMQGLPSPGFTGPFAGSPPLYAKKHDPFLLIPAIAGDPARAARVVPLEQLQADLDGGTLPTFAFVVPDLCHDLHGAPSCTGRAALDRAGDAFVQHWVEAIRASSAWRGNAAIVVTFDEGGDATNHVATVVIARDGPRGVVLHERTDHYALLATLERAWGLPLLGRAADAPSMAPLFR